MNLSIVIPGYEQIGLVLNELSDMVVGRLHAHLGHDDASRYLLSLLRPQPQYWPFSLASPARGSADSLR